LVRILIIKEEENHEKLVTSWTNRWKNQLLAH